MCQRDAGDEKHALLPPHQPMKTAVRHGDTLRFSLYCLHDSWQLGQQVQGFVTIRQLKGFKCSMQWLPDLAVW